MSLPPRERRVRLRARDDFAYYARKSLKIRTKSGDVVPFELNEAQTYLHGKLEDQRAIKGRVRAIIVKGRQQGCSTYVGGRYYHQTTHRRGIKAFILTHHKDATENLFAITDRYHTHCHPWFKPETGTSNAKELTFNRLDSGYRVGTAGSKAVGRSDTLQLFHGSEVAYWPNARDHLSGIMQAIPDEPGTEVILESTSSGPHGVFYDMAMDALCGNSDYELIFIPWYWQTEYRRPVPDGFQKTPEEIETQERYGLDDEQMVWRRAKVMELGGLDEFYREYPSTVEEAFSAQRQGAVYDALPSDFWSSEWAIDFDPEKHRRLKTYLSIDPGYRKSAWLWMMELEPTKWVVFDEMMPERKSDAECVEMVNARGWEIDEIWTDPAAEATQSALNLDTIAMVQRIKTRTATPVRYISGPFRSIKYGVSKTRQMLGDPSIGMPIRVFFAKRLQQIEVGQRRGVVKDLLLYRYPDEKEDRPTPGEPLKDGITDHANDSFRYWAVGMWLQSPLRRSDPRIEEMAKGKSGIRRAG